MTAIKIPDIIKETARKLRQEMTNVEFIIWDKLRAKRLKSRKFLRQYPIYVYTENSGLDRFIIPDFVCKEEKLIIELDGSIHNLKDIYLLDLEKEKLLENIGYKIIRFKNEEIINDESKVLEKIAASFS